MSKKEIWLLCIFIGIVFLITGFAIGYHWPHPKKSSLRQRAERIIIKPASSDRVGYAQS